MWQPLIVFSQNISNFTKQFLRILCRIHNPLIFITKWQNFTQKKHLVSLLYPYRNCSFSKACIPLSCLEMFSNLIYFYLAHIFFEIYNTHTQFIYSNPSTLLLGGYHVGTLVYTNVVQVSTRDNTRLRPWLYGLDTRYMLATY